MKLRNKKTGEIVEVESLYLTQTQELYLNYTNKENKQEVYMTDKIASFNSEWEDYEEPKQHWFIATDGRILECNEDASWSGEKSIGNYFGTREEAKKAVEMLKAWKRLKDKGFKFDGWSAGLGKNKIYTIFWSHNDGEFDLRKDLDLLFGGEE